MEKIAENLSALRRLYDGAKANNVEDIRAVISKLGYVNLKRPEHDGSTPFEKALHIAVCENKKDSHFGTIKVLLDNGANVNARNASGETPLHCLVRDFGVKMEVLKLILDFEPDVNIKDENGDIPLFRAITNSNVAAVQLLAKHGSDLDSTNKQGLTALHLATSFCCNLKVLKSLLKNGANANAIDNKGQIAIFILVEKSWFARDFEKRLLYLLKYSDVNVIDDMGNNLLNLFTDRNGLEICLKHIALIQVLFVPINRRILNNLLKHEICIHYFIRCRKELFDAKNTKLQNFCISFFHFLIDDRKKLKNYARNAGLIKDFESSDSLIKFPIYGPTMKKNMRKGIKRSELFDQSLIVLSSCLPILKSNFLIMRNIFDCLATEDLSRLCEQY